MKKGVFSGKAILSLSPLNLFYKRTQSLRTYGHNQDHCQKPSISDILTILLTLNLHSAPLFLLWHCVKCAMHHSYHNLSLSHNHPNGPVDHRLCAHLLLSSQSSFPARYAGVNFRDARHILPHNVHAHEDIHTHPEHLHHVIR